MNKTKVTISIDPYILDEAKKKNINISETTERALANKTNPANIPEEELTAQAYPFEICETSIPPHLKTVLFGCASIKARRCKKCDKIYFVNDLAGNFTICRNCFNA